MRKAFIFLLALLSPGMITVTRAVDLRETGPFHSIVVSSEIVAELVLSKKEAVEPDFKNASGDDLLVQVVDSVLKIRMKTGTYKDAVLKVKIYYTQDLRMLEANGRAQIWSEEGLYFERNLDVKLFNGGEMRFRLQCDSLNANLSQGSVISLTGEARAQKVKVTTGATFSGYEFRTEKAYVAASGGGKAKVSASVYLDANASSKGFIGYVGEPARVDEKTSLMGEVMKTVLEE
jgi:hypothetical protein